MQKSKMTQVGSICSILSGIIFLISGIGFFLFQVRGFDWSSIESVSVYFSIDPYASAKWAFVNFGAVLASFLAIAGVLALSDEIQLVHAGLVRWTGTLAIIGYSIIAVTNVADFYEIKRLALSYGLLDKSAQSALEAMGSGSLDPALNLRFLTIGPWFLAAGWLSLHDDILPKVLACLGLVAGIAALLFVLVSLLEMQTLTLVTGSLAVIFHPIWLIWTGFALRRVGKGSEQESTGF